MGLQSPESGVPGEGSFPACQHSSAPAGTGPGLLREGPRLISIPRAYSLRCAGRACRGQPGLPANKAPFIRPASPRPRAAADGQPPHASLQTRARDPERTGRDSEAGCGPGHPGSFFGGLHQEGPSQPAFIPGPGDCGHRVCTAGKSCLLAARCERRRPPPPLSLGMVRPEVPQVVRGPCFFLAASEIPTKGSLPDFCVSSVQCLESSYRLFVTKYITASLLYNFFQDLKQSCRLKFGTVASQQRLVFPPPSHSWGKEKQRRKRTCSPPSSASKHISSALHVRPTTG